MKPKSEVQKFSMEKHTDVLLVLEKNEADLFIVKRVCKVAGSPFHLVMTRSLEEAIHYIDIHPDSGGVLLADLDTVEACRKNAFLDLESFIRSKAAHWTLIQLHLYLAKCPLLRCYTIEKPLTVEHIHLIRETIKKPEV